MSASSSDRKIGQILLEMKLVSVEKLAEVMQMQAQMKAKGEPALKLGQMLVALKLITLEQLQGALRQQTNKAQENREMVQKAKAQVIENRAHQDAQKAARTSRISSAKPSSGLLQRLGGIFRKKT